MKYSNVNLTSSNLTHTIYAQILYFINILIKLKNIKKMMILKLEYFFLI